MNNNFDIASRISKVKWSEQDQQQIQNYLSHISSDKEEQMHFFEYCKQWKLAPWVCSKLQKENLLDKFSPEIKILFIEIHERIKEENEKRNKEAIRFLTEFNKRNIEVVILKGNLLAHTVYKDVGYKKMNDFDILIKAEDWERIQDVYLDLGYIPLGFGWSGEKQKAAKFSHVGMSFISADYACITGSQWGLKSPSAGYNVNIEEAWETAEDFDFFGVKVKQLSTEYNLLHLILHMGIYKCGIRDCMDVYNLWMEKDVDTEKLVKLLERSKAMEKGYFTFYFSNLCSNAIPQSFLRQLNQHKNTFINRRLKKRILVHENSGDFQDSYNDYFQDVEKVVIYFNLFPEFHKRIVLYGKLLWAIYFPPLEFALKLSDKPASTRFIDKIKARIKAPYFVFSMIAQEIGWKFTILLFMKLFFDLLFSLKNYVIKKESYFDFLKKRGINPKEIERVVKNIQ